MKKQTEPLFELIKSMTGSEKRYFVKYAHSLPGKKGIKRHMELFGTITAMKAYDEGQLLQKLSEMKFPEQIHRIKHYLYNSILNCLEQYHRKATKTNKLLTAIKQATILSQRGLFNQSDKLLEKTDALYMGSMGLQNHVFTLKMHNYLAINQGKKQNIIPLIDKITKSCDTYLASMQAYRTYSLLYQHYSEFGQARNTAETRKFKKIYTDAVKSIDKDKLDLYGRINLLNANAICGLICGEIYRAVNSYETISKTLLEKIHYLADKKDFVQTTFNYYTVCLQAQEYLRVEKEMKGLEEWYKTNKHLLNEETSNEFLELIHLTWFHLLVKDHTRLNDHKLTSRIFTFIDNHIANPVNTLSPLKDYRYHFYKVLLFTYRNQLQEAIEVVNEMLNAQSEYKEISPTQFIEIELVNLFLHAKASDHTLLQYMITNTKRKIRKDKTLNPADFPPLILKHFSTFPGYANSAQIHKWKKELISSIKQYRSQQSVNFSYLDFDYIWYFENIF